jgi:hypothetical protein
LEKNEIANLLTLKTKLLKSLFTGFNFFQQHQVSREMIAVAAPVSVAIPGPHRVAFIAADVFHHVFLIENMLLVIEETALVFVQPG